MKMTQKILYAVAGFVIGNTLLALLCLGVYYYASVRDSMPRLNSLNDAIARIHDPALSEVRFESHRVIFTRGDDSEVFQASSDLQLEMLWSRLDDRNVSGRPVRVSVTEENGRSLSRVMLTSSFPMLLLVGVPMIVIITLLFLILLKLNGKGLD